MGLSTSREEPQEEPSFEEFVSAEELGEQSDESVEEFVSAEEPGEQSDESVEEFVSAEEPGEQPDEEPEPSYFQRYVTRPISGLWNYFRGTEQPPSPPPEPESEPEPQPPSEPEPRRVPTDPVTPTPPEPAPEPEPQPPSEPEPQLPSEPEPQPPSEPEPETTPTPEPQPPPSPPSEYDVHVWVGSESIENPQIDVTTLPIDYSDTDVFYKQTVRIPADVAGWLLNSSLDPNDEAVKAVLIDFTDDWFAENAFFNMVVDVIPQSQESLSVVEPDSEISASEEDVLDYPLFGDAQFPYVHFVNPQPIKHDNCLLNILLNKYAKYPDKPTNRISPKTIQNFFDTTNIRRAMDFFNKYKIGYRIFDITGKTMFYKKTCKECSYPSIALMVFKNHVCMYDMHLVGDTDFTISTEHDIEGYFNTGHNSNLEDYKPPTEIFVPGLTKCHPNFTFACESNVIPKSLVYHNPEYIGQAFDGRDMNKAFYTSIMGCPQNVPIGIFTMLDEIQPFEWTGNLDGDNVADNLIRSEGVYFITNEAVKKIKGQLNNVILGFRLKYELSMKVLSASDITHYRLPTYTTTVKVLQELLKDRRDYFSTDNGMLGRVAVKATFVRMFVGLNDLKLLLMYHPLLTYTTHPQDSYLVNVPARDRLHIYLNSRNLYAFVIELTNYEMRRKMDEFRLANPEATLVKVQVDCVAYDGVANYDMFNDNFKLQWTKVRDSSGKVSYIDPDKLRLSMNEERKQIVDKYFEAFTGDPGTGKTHYTNENRDYLVAGSHYNRVARGIPGGVTIWRMFNLSKLETFYTHCKRYRNKTIWIDEFQTTPAWIWGVFFTLSTIYNTKFILTGDPMQSGPCMEPSHLDGEFFKYLVDNSKKFTEQYRFSGELKNWLDRFNSPVPVCGATASRTLDKTTKAWNWHPPQNAYVNEMDPNLNLYLVLSNKCRRAINERLMKDRELSFNPPSPGLRVMSHNAVKSLNLAKHVICEVVATTTEGVQVKEIYPPTGNTGWFEADNFLKNFEVAFAVTMDSCIGMNIKEPAGICEIYKVLYWPDSLRRLKTTVTRFSDMSLMKLYRKYPDGILVEPTPQDDEVFDDLPTTVATPPPQTNSLLLASGTHQDAATPLPGVRDAVAPHPVAHTKDRSDLLLEAMAGKITTDQWFAAIKSSATE